MKAFALPLNVACLHGEIEPRCHPRNSPINQGPIKRQALNCLNWRSPSAQLPLDVAAAANMAAAVAAVAAAA